MQVLILAGGFGSRLMPVIYDRPKVMAPINNQPFLEYLIRYLKKKGFCDIVLALGYLSGYIKDYFKNGKEVGVRIQYSEEDMPLGTAGAIKNAAKFLSDEFIVINGDTFISLDFRSLMSFHADKKADVTIVLTKKGEIDSRGSVRLNKSAQVVSFEQISSTDKNSQVYINAGVYLMKRKIVKLIKSNHKVSLEKEIFPQFVQRKIPFYGFIVETDYLDIGTPERFAKAKDILK